MKTKINKRCPRCNYKMPFDMDICPNCELNYQKFNLATNRAAKKAYREGEKEQVLLRTGLPSDVKRWKLLLLAIFLGFAGVHHYYVGRKWMGLFYTVFFIVGVTNAVICTMLKTAPKGDLYEIFTLLVLVWGFVLILWIVDIAKIILNKYKVPVSVDEEK